MAELLVRAVTSSGEPEWGNSQAGWLENSDALAQLLRTRLSLFVGEFWASKADGLWDPLTGGNLSPEQKVLLLQQRILSTPYVTGISNLDFSSNPTTRQFTFSCTVESQFGRIQLSNAPSTPSQQLP